MYIHVHVLLRLPCAMSVWSSSIKYLYRSDGYNTVVETFVRVLIVSLFTIYIKAPGLFDGLHFYFSTIPPLRLAKEDLTCLVELAGGHMLARDPRTSANREGSLVSGEHGYPYHAKPGSVFSECHTFVVTEEREGDCLPVRDKAVVTVSTSWVLDCLSQFKLIELPP